MPASVDDRNDDSSRVLWVLFECRSKSRDVRGRLCRRILFGHRQRKNERCRVGVGWDRGTEVKDVI